MYTYVKEYCTLGDPYYNCLKDSHIIGTIAMASDGFYYFYQNDNVQMWDSASMIDVGRKLEALNENWKQHLESLKVKTE